MMKFFPVLVILAGCATQPAVSTVSYDGVYSGASVITWHNNICYIDPVKTVTVTGNRFASVYLAAPITAQIMAGGTIKASAHRTLPSYGLVELTGSIDGRTLNLEWRAPFCGVRATLTRQS